MEDSFESKLRHARHFLQFYPEPIRSMALLKIDHDHLARYPVATSPEAAISYSFDWSNSGLSPTFWKEAKGLKYVDTKSEAVKEHFRRHCVSYQGCMNSYCAGKDLFDDYLIFGYV